MHPTDPWSEFARKILAIAHKPNTKDTSAYFFCSPTGPASTTKKDHSHARDSHEDRE